jgi:hypothetical protein
MKLKSNINYKEHQTRSPPGSKSFYSAFVVTVRFHSLSHGSGKYDLSNKI